MRFTLAVLFGLAVTLPAAAQEPLAAPEPPPGGDPGDTLTVLTSFAEFGEPLYPPGFEHFDYVNPDAPKGGAVTLAAFGTFETLNTLPLAGDWAAGLGLVSDSLMVGSQDELSTYYPLIAESVAIPEDVSYAIFTINPAARYHDGHPITAADFVYAFEALNEVGRPFLRSFFADITRATAIDERHVRYDFATTETLKTLGLAASLWPYPRHYWQQPGRDIGASYLEPALYNGPYTIDSVDAGRSITYRRVEHYWAADLPVNVGRHNFDRIRYIYFRDDTVMFEAFKAGQYDFRTENRAQRWATGYDFAAALDERVRRDAVPVETPFGYRGFVFNTRRPIFQDERVREALTHLFDFEWTRDNIFYGYYTRARSYFPNSDYGVGDFPLPEGRELELLEPFRDQLPPELFEEPFTLPETDGSGRIRAQLREAWRLLAEAGWEVQNGVLRNVETGAPFEIEILLGSDSLLRVVQPFAQNLERAGIRANVRIVDTAQYGRRLDDYDFDMIYIALNFFPPPGPEQRNFWGSEAADVPGSGNFAGIRNPVVDALVEEIIRAETLEDLKAANRALDRVLLWHDYGIPSYYNAEIWIAYWDMFGFPEERPRYGVGFPDTWWVDAGRARQLRR